MLKEIHGKRPRFARDGGAPLKNGFAVERVASGSIDNRRAVDADRAKQNRRSSEKKGRIHRRGGRDAEEHQWL